MQIGILRDDDAIISGENYTKPMQNTSMSLLDVLVRESVQNSLDAAISDTSRGSVNVDIITGSFDSVLLNNEFEYIGPELSSRYGESPHDFIAIRDSGTTGLEGLSDVLNQNNLSRLQFKKTRLYALIYDIFNGQSKEGAGGSWGLGKTTYFKFGVGLVIYYSRIKENGEYIDLLAATYIDRDPYNPVITEPGNRGIAFFGERKTWSVDPNPLFKGTIPITNSSEISRILSYFGLELYASEATGTTIIIPYMEFDSHLKELFPPGTDTSHVPDWGLDISKALSIILQRWYAPRLDPTYTYYSNGPWLSASVNGTRITSASMHPLFRTVLDLYGFASSVRYEPRYITSISRFSIAEFGIKQISKGKAGRIASISVGTRELKLSLNKANHDIFAYLGLNTSRPCITAYVRKPGMIICYETEKPWAPSIEPESGQIILSVFKPFSDSVVTHDGVSLEQYLRFREQSYHDRWPAGDFIINKIANMVSSKIEKFYQEKSALESDRISKLSRYYDKLFLPSNSGIFTASPGRTSSGSGIKGIRSVSKARSTFGGSSIDSRGVRSLDLELNGGSTKQSVTVRFLIRHELSSFESFDWEKDTDHRFPMSVSSVRIVGFLMSGRTMNDVDVSVDFSSDSFVYESFSVHLLKTEKFGVPYALKFIMPPKSKLKVSVDLVSDDPVYSFEFKQSSEAIE